MFSASRQVPHLSPTPPFPEPLLFRKLRAALLCYLMTWSVNEENENAHPVLVVLVDSESLDDSQVLRSYIDIF